MKLKKVFVIAGAIMTAYLVGKVSGARIGAKAVLDTYEDKIPDDTFTVKLVDNVACTVTTVAKKGK